MTDPIDQTPTPATEPPMSDGAREPTAAGTATDAPAGGPRLEARADRPADSGWREPPWFPSRARRRERPSSAPAIVFGLVLIAIGAWFFLKSTLGVALPSIPWGSLWPIVLIIIGGLLLVRSFGRRA